MLMGSIWQFRWPSFGKDKAQLCHCLYRMELSAIILLATGLPGLILYNDIILYMAHFAIAQ